MAKDPVRVLVTEATGQIGYYLVPMIARGVLLGADQPVILHMHDNSYAAEALNAIKKELVDVAFPILKGVVATTDVNEAFKGVNVAVIAGGFPRSQGTERKDVMSKDYSIRESQIYEELDQMAWSNQWPDEGTEEYVARLDITIDYFAKLAKGAWYNILRTNASALEQYAAPNCKVLVVGNHANTNAIMLKEFAPSIPEKNITCLTRLDHYKALCQISERLNVQVSDIKNVIIWGNHSSTQYPDVNHATVKTSSGEKPVRELVADDAWLSGEFITTVQSGAAIIKARKLSSVMSVASSACDHIRDWVLGTPEGTWVSMGVYSDGSYNVPAKIIYSFPVTCKDGEWEIVQGLPIDELSRQKMDATGAELVKEKASAYSCLQLVQKQNQSKSS